MTVYRIHIRPSGVLMIKKCPFYLPSTQAEG